MDYVFCVINSDVSGLTIGKKYEVTKRNSGRHSNSDKSYENLWVLNDHGIEAHYSSKRFLSIVDWRNIKINEIIKA
jgi:hypothetical protein